MCAIGVARAAFEDAAAAAAGTRLGSELTLELCDLRLAQARDVDTGSLVLERSIVSKQVFYRANRSHPVFPELRALVAKTFGTIPMLRSALAHLADSISLTFIYDSVARGEEKSDSDIDLMVIGKASLEDVLGELRSVEASLRRAVNPVSPSEFKTKLASANHFLNSVVRGDKIFLIGDEDELRKVGGIRLAQNGTDKS